MPFTALNVARCRRRMGSVSGAPEGDGAEISSWRGRRSCDGARKHPSRFVGNSPMQPGRDAGQLTRSTWNSGMVNQLEFQSSRPLA